MVILDRDETDPQGQRLVLQLREPGMSPREASYVRGTFQEIQQALAHLYAPSDASHAREACPLCREHESLEIWLRNCPQLIQELAIAFPPGSMLEWEGTLYYILGYVDGDILIVCEINPWEDFHQAVINRRQVHAALFRETPRRLPSMGALVKNPLRSYLVPERFLGGSAKPSPCIIPLSG